MYFKQSYCLYYEISKTYTIFTSNVINSTKVGSIQNSSQYYHKLNKKKSAQTNATTLRARCISKCNTTSFPLHDLGNEKIAFPLMYSLEKQQKSNHPFSLV